MAAWAFFWALLGLSGAQTGLLDAVVELALLGLHLLVLGVQLSLFVLQLGALLHELGAVGHKGFLRSLHVVEYLGVLHRDVLHDLIEGQKLVQIVHRLEHGDAAAVPQLLHGGHMALEIVPLVGDLLLFPGDLILLGGDLLLFDTDAVLHLGDLGS